MILNRILEWKSGQPVSNVKLAEKIRSRGVNGDDSGHIVANVLGGKMVEFNLNWSPYRG